MQSDRGLIGRRFAILAFIMIICVGTAFMLARSISDGFSVRIEGKELPSETAQRLGAAPDRAYDPLPLKMADLGGVGFTRDPDLWRASYSHNPRQFRSFLLTEAPYVDQAALTSVVTDLETYLDRIESYGINAVEMPGFLELVTFDEANGIYEAAPSMADRHRVWRAAYAVLLATIDARGMDAYLRTDMVALTPQLEAYLDRKGLHVEDDAFWSVYAAGLQELFGELPSVDGMIVRIGEAGSPYDAGPWDYHSELLVQDVAAVQAMLRAFLSVAEEADRTLIFRTWSVGFGEVGHMHSEPADYETVLSEVSSPNLIISTKHTQGDFWSTLPVNPTLLVGDHRRIVELQARREFETFGAVPSYMGPLFSQALRSVATANPNLEGVWIWTQSGGPVYRSQRSFYPLEGFWLFNDLNSYAAARLAASPGDDPRAVASAWIEANLTADEELAAALTDWLMQSAEVVPDALTIGPFARKKVFGLGHEVPTMSLSYWDIVHGDLSTFSVKYRVVAASDAGVRGALKEATAATRYARQQRDRIVPLLGRMDRAQKDQADGLAASLDYQVSLFETLEAYKRAYLVAYAWVDQGGRERRAEALSAASEYEAAVAEHLAALGEGAAFPAYNFTPADRLIRIVKRADVTAWSARLALLTALGFFALSVARRLGAGLLVGLAAVVVILTTGAFTSWTAPVYATAALAPFVAYGVVAGCMLRHATEALSKAAVHRRLALVLAAPVVTAVLLAASLSRTGPLGFWLPFWTDDAYRTAYLTLLIAATFFGYATLWFGLRGGSIRTTAARFAVVVGASWLTGGTIIATVGTSRFADAVNLELSLFPYLLNLLYGTAEMLGVPSSLPTWLAAGAAFIFVIGLIGAPRSAGVRHALQGR
ncbi:MAG: hypothetical protein AAF830_10485 [Pseudomonadota bacterium]